jgi:hypothetical protein
LGQKRKDATKEQIKESQDVVDKLNSTTKTKVEKRFVMNKVFGDYRKVNSINFNTELPVYEGNTRNGKESKRRRRKKKIKKRKTKIKKIRRKRKTRRSERGSKIKFHVLTFKS